MRYQSSSAVLAALAILFLGGVPVGNSEVAADPIIKWGGSLVVDGMKSEPTFFKVRLESDRHVIFHMKSGGGDYPVKNFDWADDTMTFIFKMSDSEASCKLKKQKVFEYFGHCKTEGSDMVVDLTVIPKVKQTEVEEPSESGEQAESAESAQPEEPSGSDEPAEHSE